MGPTSCFAQGVGAMLDCGRFVTWAHCYYGPMLIEFLVNSAFAVYEAAWIKGSIAV